MKMKTSNTKSASLLWITTLFFLHPQPVESFHVSHLSARQSISLHAFSSSNVGVKKSTSTPSFQERMLELMRRENNTAQKRRQRQQLPKIVRPDTIQEIRSWKEFKEVAMTKHDNKIVIARFYSPYCRACRAMEQGFFALAKRNRNMKFIQLSTTSDESTKDLDHEIAEGVPSVPYVHMYHPDCGLVEAQRFTRKDLALFHHKLQDYIDGSCSLELRGEWSAIAPY